MCFGERCTGTHRTYEAEGHETLVYKAQMLTLNMCDVPVYYWVTDSFFFFPGSGTHSGTPSPLLIVVNRERNIDKDSNLDAPTVATVDNNT